MVDETECLYGEAVRELNHESIVFTTECQRFR